MTIDHFLGALRRRWLAFLVCLIAGVGGATYHLQHTVRIFDSSVRVFVNFPTSGGIQQTTNAVQLSLQLLQSYATIATSDATTQAIRQNLALAPGEPLDGTLSAVVEPNTLLLKMTAASSSPQRAQQLANASAAALDSVLRGLSSDPASHASIRVLDPARTPTSPSSPSKKRSLVLGILFGLLGGIGIVVALESFDRTIRTLVAGRAVLRTSGIAVIPSRRRMSRKPLAALEPSDPMAESFRALRTAIQFADRVPPVRSLLITSPQPAEGKTTIACNLAVTLAQAGERVCLVDADLRRSGIPKVFGIDPTAGLTSVVLGEMPISAALVERHGVSVLPAGPVRSNPSELLGSEMFSRLLDELTKRFNVVIIDAPPILPVTDAVVLSTQVDAVLLVVKFGKSKQPDGAQARDLLSGVSAHTIGFVLNATQGRFSNYRYQSYSNSLDVSQGMLDVSQGIEP